MTHGVRRSSRSLSEARCRFAQALEMQARAEKEKEKEHQKEQKKQLLVAAKHTRRNGCQPMVVEGGGGHAGNRSSRLMGRMVRLRGSLDAVEMQPFHIDCSENLLPYCDAVT